MRVSLFLKYKANVLRKDLPTDCLKVGRTKWFIETAALFEKDPNQSLHKNRWGIQHPPVSPVILRHVRGQTVLRLERLDTNGADDGLGRGKMPRLKVLTRVAAVRAEFAAQRASHLTGLITRELTVHLGQVVQVRRVPHDDLLPAWNNQKWLKMCDNKMIIKLIKNI